LGSRAPAEEGRHANPPGPARRRMKSIGASACMLALLAACGSPPPPPADPAPLPVQQPAAPVDPVEWSGSLLQAAGSPVEGTVVAHVYPTRTIVAVRVRGVQGDVGMPWHLHEGTCDTPGGAVVGPESGYPLLRPGQDPTVASHSELFGIPLQSGRRYKVDVHATLARAAPIVACANLTQRP
jgi:hypothetical protein